MPWDELRMGRCFRGWGAVVSAVRSRRVFLAVAVEASAASRIRRLRMNAWLAWQEVLAEAPAPTATSAAQTVPDTPPPMATSAAQTLPDAPTSTSAAQTLP
ncbi:unnamed protein product, partial [Symbiodinium pilosum]